MNRSKSEGVGHKARRYRERSNSNTEVKETMKVAIAAKKVVILLMTMALAVAFVACQAAVPRRRTPSRVLPESPASRRSSHPMSRWQFPACLSCKRCPTGYP